MAEVPQPRRPGQEEYWDEFWDVMVDAIAEAKIRQAREALSGE